MTNPRSTLGTFSLLIHICFLTKQQRFELTLFIVLGYFWTPEDISAFAIKQGNHGFPGPREI